MSSNTPRPTIFSLVKWMPALAAPKDDTSRQSYPFHMWLSKKMWPSPSQCVPACNGNSTMSSAERMPRLSSVPE